MENARGNEAFYLMLELNRHQKPPSDGTDTCKCSIFPWPAYFSLCPPPIYLSCFFVFSFIPVASFLLSEWIRKRVLNVELAASLRKDLTWKNAEMERKKKKKEEERRLRHNEEGETVGRVEDKSEAMGWYIVYWGDPDVNSGDISGEKKGKLPQRNT